MGKRLDSQKLGGLYGFQLAPPRNKYYTSFRAMGLACNILAIVVSLYTLWRNAWDAFVVASFMTFSGLFNQAAASSRIMISHRRNSYRVSGIVVPLSFRRVQIKTIVITVFGLALCVYVVINITSFLSDPTSLIRSLPGKVIVTALFGVLLVNELFEFIMDLFGVESVVRHRTASRSVPLDKDSEELPGDDLDACSLDIVPHRGVNNFADLEVQEEPTDES